MLNVRSPRNALVIAAAVTVGSLMATGCGSTPSESGAASTVAPTTSSTLRTINAAAAGGPGGGQSGDSKVSAGGWAASPEASMQLAWVEYVIDGELPALADTAGAWLFETGATATLDQVARLASAFGITEPPVAVTGERGGGWQVGPLDGSAPSLTVTNSATLDWYFSPGWATMSDSPVACAGIATAPVDGQIDPAVANEAIDPAEVDETIDPVDTVVNATESTQTVPDCAPPAPLDVPSADEAQALASGLLEAAGLNPSAGQLDVYADSWGASVTAYTMVGDFRSPFSTSFGFGEQGAITWAGGTLATPTPAGDYPLITAAAGIDRLNSQSKQWIRIEGGPQVGQVDPALVDPPLGAPVETPIGFDPGVVVAAPNKIAVTGVRLDLTSIWDVDGTIWLLPAYTYTNSDGVVATVAAVTDEYLQTPDVQLPDRSTVPPETLPVETLPVETVPVETSPVETPPVGPVPVEPGPIPTVQVVDDTLPIDTIGTIPQG